MSSLSIFIYIFNIVIVIMRQGYGRALSVPCRSRRCIIILSDCRFSLSEVFDGRRVSCQKRMDRRAEVPSAACLCYAAPDSRDDPLGTRTILPITPPFPSNSCACLASVRGNRCAMSGLIFFCWRRSNRVIKSCRNQAGFSRLSHWML
jgi:hypothetical protein